MGYNLLKFLVKLVAITFYNQCLTKWIFGEVYQFCMLSNGIPHTIESLKVMSQKYFLGHYGI